MRNNMTSLTDCITNLREKIHLYRDRAPNEQNTKAALIDPVLRALGWNMEDLDEVQREYKPKAADNPVDYALLILRTPRLFVEAKALTENLDDRRWASQIMGYASVAGVEWVVLTNGNEYRIYNAHAPVPVEEKLFRTVRLTDAQATAEETLDLLSKERLQENQIDTLWKAYFVDRQIRATLSSLFSPDPDPSIVSLVRRRLPALTPSDIRASLNRMRIQFDLPAEPEGRSLASARKPRMVATTRPTRTTASAQVRQGKRTRIELRHLIETGFIVPPLTIEATFKKRRLVACVESNGEVTFQEQKCDSLSHAGGVAQIVVNGPPPDGLTYWKVNGWTFWQFRDRDGTLKPMDVLRDYYRKSV